MPIAAGLCLVQAQHNCTHCYGLGRRASRHGRMVVCRCVYRAIFRETYARFRVCASDAGHCGRVDFDRLKMGDRGAKGCYGLKKQEFAADFCLVAMRTLTEPQHRIFRFHLLLGAEWSICCAKLGMSRGAFFHEVYRIQELLGRAYAETAPHALWPCPEYFGLVKTGRKLHPVLAIEHEHSVVAASVASAFPLAMVAA